MVVSGKAAAALAVMACMGLPPHASAQGSLASEYCIDHKGAYLTGSIILSYQIIGAGRFADSSAQLLRADRLAAGFYQCFRVQIPPEATRRGRPQVTAMVHLTALSFTGFNEVRACNLALPIPLDRNSKVTVTLRGTTFHPYCQES